MKDRLFNEIKYLKEFYEEYPNENKLNIYNIKEKEYILANSEILSIIELMISQKNINYDKINEYITKIFTRSISNREMSAYNRIRKMLKDYILEEKYNISSIRKNENIKYIFNRFDIISHQCKNFDSFKENQNNFDNMISIIKIIQRLNNYNIKINIHDIYFNKEIDNSNLAKDLILLKGLEDFRSVRFMI